MWVKKYKWVIGVFFLLILVEISILKLREEISLVTILEIASACLFIILYYFIIKTELRIGSKVIEERFQMIETKFEKLENKLREEIQFLKLEIAELRKIMESLNKDIKILKKRH
ncbi:MAG: hypothetical protein OH319_03225 [Candidatus Parvarchaeota archaeon]|nr:hypothetical protein [Candidatus Jingweiarchaeum tengchongense]MCW1298507.1 hypothetical protein [Candidatus Jingweiarchaeum tengchongense]MCW1300247.1 hypothetical protein [Candidatus Jingweiarchaeum tengchongense]MCW1304519.1 hypothetical protein [Candidatus Jingweiarchaeum tengchongense]MCW1305753.1 hypothetical protein [Candidatus Jingweiarchaeum tengchongense]